MITTAVAATLGTVFPAGYNMCNLNIPQNIIKNFCNESVFHNYGGVLGVASLHWLWACVVSIFLAGGCIGATVGGPVLDDIGRKKGLLLNLILYIIGSSFFYYCKNAQSVELLIVGRFIIGIAAGFSTMLFPVYMNEIATEDIKSVLGILCTIGITTGVFVGEILGLDIILGNEDNWHLVLASTAVPVTMCAAVWFLLPESPRYLIVTKHKTEEGSKELSRLRNKPIEELEDEIQSLLREAEDEKTEVDVEDKSKWTIKRVWGTQHQRVPFMCALVLHCGYQLCGINAVFYYSTSIFFEAGLDKQKSEYTTLTAGFVHMAMNVLGVILIDRFRRRTLILVSMIGLSIFLVILAIGILNLNTAAWIPPVCIASLILYVIFFDIGLGPLAFFLPSELIEAGPRPVVITAGSTLNWIMNFVVAICFPTLEAVVGPYTFLIFFSITVVFTVFLFYKLPETKPNKNSQIEKHLRENL